MITIRTISDLLHKISLTNNAQVGFVPTMGALHQGHISLVEKCVKENDICVVSIFVNPTQFNDKNDLAKYPRTPYLDAALLEKAGCDILFTPSVSEMYPTEDTRIFYFGNIERVMEGRFRPGHFNGVAQIVSKLFDAVKPDKAYFGEKDFQQVAIIKAMVKQLTIPVEIVACPIVREDSGLARSSRNTLLTEEQRKKAALIFKVLSKSITFVAQKTPAEVCTWVAEQFADDKEFRLDYYEIVDANSLESIKDWSESKDVVGCIAIYCGNIRLIDNIHYTK